MFGRNLPAVALLAAWLFASAGCDRPPAPAPSREAPKPAGQPGPAPARPVDQPPEAPPPVAQAPRRVLKVLFIGNSYTYVNDLPGTLVALAKAAGDGPLLETQSRATGGAKLEDHWNHGAADAIAATPWDFVVLQEQSVTPLAKFGRDTVFFPAARKLHGAIKARGASTLFYMSWKRPDTAGTQEDWTQPYLDITRELGARVAPAGMALEIVLKKKPKFAFYADMGGHPTPAGTYLVACTFYAAIFDKSPAGLPATVTTAGGQEIGVPGDDAALVQGAAWEAMATAKKRLSAEK